MRIAFFVILGFVVLVIALRTHRRVSAGRIMRTVQGLGTWKSLDEARGALTTAMPGKVRKWSTFDFGRERDPSCTSIIVPENESREILREVRRHLGPGLISFVGTHDWLGEEKHAGVELVIAEGKDQFDILRVARTDAVNYDMMTDELIAKLKAFDARLGIDIELAKTDTIVLRLISIPDDLTGFAREIYEFCPDAVDQGVGSVEALAAEIQRSKEVCLWWD